MGRTRRTARATTRATWHTRTTHHGGWLREAFARVWRARGLDFRSPLWALNLICWSYTVPSHRLPPLRACSCSQTTPNRKSRQEQDGELAVLLDLLEPPLNVFSVPRVSTSKSTTSRRATVPPPRARIRTCSCWSRYVCTNFYDFTFLNHVRCSSTVSSPGARTLTSTRSFRIVEVM